MLCFYADAYGFLPKPPQASVFSDAVDWACDSLKHTLAFIPPTAFDPMISRYYDYSYWHAVRDNSFPELLQGITAPWSLQLFEEHWNYSSAIFHAGIEALETGYNVGAISLNSCLADFKQGKGESVFNGEALATHTLNRLYGATTLLVNFGDKDTQTPKIMHETAGLLHINKSLRKHREDRVSYLGGYVTPKMLRMAMADLTFRVVPDIIIATFGETAPDELEEEVFLYGRDKKLPVVWVTGNYWSGKRRIRRLFRRGAN